MGLGELSQQIKVVELNLQNAYGVSRVLTLESYLRSPRGHTYTYIDTYINII